MIALDTNIIVRLFAAAEKGEDAEQQQVAAALLKSEKRFFVPVTVTLESVWVLEILYRQPAASIKRALDALAALPNIVVEDALAVARAADWHVKGLDFADALHLARSEKCAETATFDRRFAKAASRLKLAPKVSAPAT
jgi:predicted nucleic-acid-binding protein